MRFLVTGASGHIGSYLTHLLLQNNEEVAIIVRPESNLWRLEGLQKNTKIIYGDLQNIEKLKNEIIDFEPDVLCHLAWFGITSEHRNDPNQLLTNVIGSLKLFNIVRQTNCKTFIGLGSQAEYGPYPSFLNEELTPSPLTSYGTSKLALGILIKKLCELSNIRYVWLRLLATYGPKDDDKHLIPSVINQLLRAEKPSLTPAEQKWDYLYVEDAAEAIYKIAFSDQASGVFNLGSGTILSIREIVELMKDIIDSKLEIGFGEIPYRNDQTMFLGTSIEKIKKASRWQPKTPLKTGLEHTINWYKNNSSIK